MPQDWRGRPVDEYTIVDAAYQAGWKRRDLLVNAVAASLGEWGGQIMSDHNAGTNQDTSIDYGPWQVNSVHWGHGPAPADIFDPYANARYAHKAWSEREARDGQGFRIWYGHTSKDGEYGDRAAQWMDTAEKWVDAYLAGHTEAPGSPAARGHGVLERKDPKERAREIMFAMSEAVRRSSGASVLPKADPGLGEGGAESPSPGPTSLIREIPPEMSEQRFAEFAANSAKPAVLDGGQPNEQGLQQAASDLGLSNEAGQRVVDLAKQYLGVNYVWGGVSATGMDCSGLVLLVMREMGIPMPRVSRDQATQGQEVSAADAQAGDLIAFDSGGQAGVVNHIGIVVGRDEDGTLLMIHAPRTGDVVKISRVTRNDVMHIRRVV